MKTIRHYLAIATAATFALLPACSQPSQQTAAADITNGASAVSTTVAALPPALVAKIKALAVKYPTAVQYADATAKALNVASTTLNKLPAPATLNNYLFWVQFDPKLAAYVNEFESVYAEFYPALGSSSATLAQIAAVVQTSK